MYRFLSDVYLIIGSYAMKRTLKHKTLNNLYRTYRKKSYNTNLFVAFIIINMWYNYLVATIKQLSLTQKEF